MGDLLSRKNLLDVRLFVNIAGFCVVRSNVDTWSNRLAEILLFSLTLAYVLEQYFEIFYFSSVFAQLLFRFFSLFVYFLIERFIYLLFDFNFLFHLVISLLFDFQFTLFIYSSFTFSFLLVIRHRSFNLILGRYLFLHRLFVVRFHIVISLAIFAYRFIPYSLSFLV